MGTRVRVRVRKGLRSPTRRTGCEHIRTRGSGTTCPSPHSPYPRVRWPCHCGMFMKTLEGGALTDPSLVNACFGKCLSVITAGASGLARPLHRGHHLLGTYPPQSADLCTPIINISDHREAARLLPTSPDLFTPIIHNLSYQRGCKATDHLSRPLHPHHTRSHTRKGCNATRALGSKF